MSTALRVDATMVDGSERVLELELQALEALEELYGIAELHLMGRRVG